MPLGRMVHAWCVSDVNRCMVIEDHPLVRDALVGHLKSELEDCDIVYAGPSLVRAVEIHETAGSDCVILDLDLGDGRLPVDNVSDLVEAGCRVLIVSALGNPAIVRRALQAGALGFVSKQAPVADIISAVRDTLRGEASTSRDAAAMMYADDGADVSLSDRERMAMVLYASGLTIDSVGRRMGVKASTAAEYIKRVREKYLRAGNAIPTKADLYRQAREEGLVS